MSDLKLEFPPDTAVENDGLGDAGIETFRDSAYASCARETGQNSRDAASAPDVPVRVTFDVLHVPRNEIPDLYSLESALHSCLDMAQEEKNQDFFTTALNAISKEKVTVLRIADYNTTGLVGPPNTRGTAFHSLLKSRGVTNKGSNEDSTGSFGIGKNAVLAVSDLQTVFYSTIYEDEAGAQQFAAQGKAILISHKGTDGVDRRPTGYWGNPEGFSAITDQTNVPSWMKRSTIGTSIFCIGFREGDGSWEDLMVCSIISNFFGAIENRQMEFEVGNTKINSNTLESLLNSSDLHNAAEGTDLEDELNFARDLHRCLISGAAITQEIEIKNLGRIKIRILTETGMPKRLGFVRNGMLITDNLSYFGHKFQRFPAAKDFICLIEPADTASNKLLKKLENPKHKDFSADRIAEPKKREAATKAMRDLGTELRNMINNSAGAKVEGAVILDELASLFAAHESSSESKSNNALDPERFIYKVVQKRPPRLGTGGGVRDLGRNSQKDRGNRGNGGNRPPGRRGSGRNGAIGTGNKKIVELKNFRNKIPKSESYNKLSRTIYFDSNEASTIQIEILALGLSSAEPLKIISSSLGSVKNGSLILDTAEAKRYAITVSFDESYDGPIEIIASIATGESE
ncbi:hypothetical protein [Pseudomonas sp. FGI182]|uniref:hypothetical protein n=1 Tax=Pseudomonas sp. FGI182 TaxID=1259844 RepID=UPI00042306BB|nr:hypothetical protein [Pseudomonas sp. FGI182]